MHKNRATEARWVFLEAQPWLFIYLRQDLPGRVGDMGESKRREGTPSFQQSPEDTGRVVSAVVGADVKGQRAEVTSC